MVNNMWNLEGMHITARYMNDAIVSGRVETSRVALGGRVKHSVVLDKPTEIFGTSRERLLINHEEVTSIKDLNK